MYGSGGARSKGVGCGGMVGRLCRQSSAKNMNATLKKLK